MIPKQLKKFNASKYIFFNFECKATKCMYTYFTSTLIEIRVNI